MKKCLFLYNSMSPFSRKKVYGGEYLAYFLPKELENFSSEVCEARNAHCDVSVHRQGHAIDALQELAYPAQGRSRRRWPALVGPGLLGACPWVSHPALGHCVDQERQGQHPHEPWEPGRLVDEQRRHKKHGGFEPPQAPVHRAGPWGARDPRRSAPGGGGDGGA